MTNESKPPKTRAARLRAWMAANEGWHTMAEVADGAGIPRRAAAVAMGDMRRLKHVVADGVPGAYRYQLSGKEPRVWGQSEAERVIRRREARMKWQRSKGVRPRAEVNAERAAKAAARKAARDASAAAERAARAASRATAKPAPRKPKPAAKRVRQPSASRVVRASATRPASQQPLVRAIPNSQTAPPKQAPAMTSDDFLRMGGKIERIPAAWEKAA